MVLKEHERTKHNLLKYCKQYICYCKFVEDV